MEALLPALKHALKQIKGDKREKHPRHTPHAAAAPVDQWERSFRAASAGSGGGCSCDPWTLMDTCIHVHVDPWTELGNQESTPERKRVLHTSYQHPCRCWSFGFVDCNVYHVRNAELLSDISPSLFHELYCDPNKVQVQFLKSSTPCFYKETPCFDFIHVMPFWSHRLFFWRRLLDSWWIVITYQTETHIS
jgi:hypothetical protein